MTDLTESGLPPEVEAKLKADGIDFFTVKTKAGVCAFRGLTRTEYQRWQAMLRNPQQAASSSSQICYWTVLHPSLQAFQTMEEKKPAITHKCGDAVLEFSGFD